MFGNRLHTIQEYTSSMKELLEQNYAGKILLMMKVDMLQVHQNTSMCLG